jgi:hypothetical protein
MRGLELAGIRVKISLLYFDARASVFILSTPSPKLNKSYETAKKTFAITRRDIMSKNFKLLMAGLLGLLALLSTEISLAAGGSFYAKSTSFQLDPKLPEPFSRAQIVYVMVNYDQQDVSLVFWMSDSEGIDVTFPMVRGQTDACGNVEIIAAPPAGSTPYYKDFEIKVIDYRGNKCEQVKVPAPTFASLKSYEVRHQATTYSTILAEQLQPAEDGHQ